MNTDLVILLCSSAVAIVLHCTAWFLVKDTALYELTTKKAFFISLPTILVLNYWILYAPIVSFEFLFICVLLITYFTDTQTHLISRFTTLFLVPFIWLIAYLEYLPITFYESLLGSFIGFSLLWITTKIAFYMTKKESIGQGDSDLLCLIGAFLGPLGMWFTLLFGSIIGSLCGAFLLFLYGKKARSIPLPFGSFLAIGAIIVLYIMYDIIIIPYI